MQAETKRSAASRSVFEPLVDQKTVLLTTYKRDGTGVGTPVHIAVDGNRAFVRTWDSTWKLKRVRNNPEVEVGPCMVGGEPTGPAIRAHARILGGDESAYAEEMLAHKYPVLHGVLIPLVHRLTGNQTMHIELRPVDG